MRELKKEIGIFIYFIKNAFGISKTYPLIVFISSALSAVFPFIAIVFPKYIIDELTGRQRTDVFVKLIAGAAITAFAVNFISKTCDKYLKVKYEEIINEFEAKMADLLSAVAYERLESPEFIDLKERAMYPLNRGVFYLFFSNIPELIKNIITLAGALTVICTFDVVIVIAILAVTGVSAYFNTRYQKKDITLQKDSIRSNKIFSYYLHLIDNRDIAKDVRLDNLSGFLMTKVIEEDNSNLEKYAKVLYRTRHFYEGVKNLFVAVQNFVVYAYIGLRALQKSISIGNFSMYVSAAATFGNSASKTLGLFIEMRQHCRYLEDYVELNRTPVEREKGKMLPASGENMEIEFRNVSFKYPKTDKIILHNINLKIKNGETISIVGRNGAGKTTFIKLLSRLYKPDSGKILLNGININDIVYDEYMKLISVIFQDFKIFEFTIADNICFDNQDEKQINCALDKAGLLGFVDSLENKAQTYIGKSCDKNGTFFSGGQMQKLAIARTIYKNSPIIILDEPTASLDPISEAEVYEKFNETIGNKTAVYISHRLSSCKFCDRIIFIDDGEIKEKGSHEQLMALNGHYAKMFKLQAESYLSKTVC